MPQKLVITDIENGRAVPEADNIQNTGQATSTWGLPCPTHEAELTHYPTVANLKIRPAFRNRWAVFALVSGNSATDCCGSSYARQDMPHHPPRRAETQTLACAARAGREQTPGTRVIPRWCTGTRRDDFAEFAKMGRSTQLKS